MEVLIAENIQKSYHNGDFDQVVLKGVTQRFKQSKIYAIIGVSGSGKTTLMNVLGGIDRPDSGRVLIGESDVYGVGERSRARLINKDIGFIFQFFNLIPEMSVWQNILLPVWIRGERRNFQDMEKRADELIKKAGLDTILKTPVNRLSGGECQRIAVIRALMNNPKVVLADEPTGSLDEENTDMVKMLFAALREEYGQTFIIATHNRKLAACADEVFELRHGQLHT